MKTAFAWLLTIVAVTLEVYAGYLFSTDLSDDLAKGIVRTFTGRE